jgi:hypothetical protein
VYQIGLPINYLSRYLDVVKCAEHFNIGYLRTFSKLNLKQILCRLKCVHIFLGPSVDSVNIKYQ